uniref:Uncharacterized protein n=1 Tax=Pyrodinium bahamense TaxID=73915 RepID=A0A7S0AA08_9DINO
MAATEDVETPLHGTDAQESRLRSAQQRVQLDGTSGFRVFFLIGVTVWQGLVLRRHSVSIQALILTGQHEKMNSSCENIFWVLSWAFFLSLVMVLLNAALGAISLVPQLNLVRGLVNAGKSLASIFEVSIAIWGIVVIAFKVRENDTLQCPELYACAWWCFVGFVLLPLVITGISCFFLAGFATGAAAAAQEAGARSSGFASAATYGSSGADPQPQVPTAVQPFAGQPHRLGPEPQPQQQPGSSE